MSLNKVILVGNVGKDPIVRYFDKGVAKATFPLATSETYRNQQGEMITSTEWHNIVLWRSLAEVAEKTVKKGSQVYIAGKIKTRSYVDKEGTNKYITEILADTLFNFDKKPTVGTESNQTPVKTEAINGIPSQVVSEPATGYNQPYDEQETNDFTNHGSAASDDDLPF
jgi:single-strand DNA-binding protein